MITTYFDNLINDFGIWEHSDGTKPLEEEGYALDDAARALILCILLKRYDEANVMFNYVKASFRDDTLYGQATAKREFFDAPAQLDPTGQAVWGLAVAWQHNFRTDEARELAERVKQMMPEPEYLRAEAYALLGALYIDPAWAAKLGTSLKTRFAGLPDDWLWPEDSLTYAVALPAYALLRYARAMGDDEAGELGLRVLKFVDDACRANGRVLGPIGSNGWYPHGGQPAEFLQQPIDAAYTIWAMMAAYENTHKREWLEKAEEWWGWFDGQNVAKQRMFDPKTNKAYDHIDAEGGRHKISTHSGAETNLCFLLSRWVLEHRRTF